MPGRRLARLRARTAKAVWMSSGRLARWTHTASSVFQVIFSLIRFCGLWRKPVFHPTDDQFDQLWISTRKILYRNNLADKKPFAELVASYERLRGTEALEQLQNLAVLESVIVRNGRADGNRFDGLVVHNAVTINMLRLAVENGQHGAARPHDLIEPFGDFGKQLRFEMIKNVPQQNGIESLFGILQRVL